MSNNLSNFKTEIQSQYPFKKGWLFDDYKSQFILNSANISNTSNIDKIIEYENISKLKSPHLLIDQFPYKFQKWPFFNPSIIRIDNIENYHNFMLKTPNLSLSDMNIIKNTMYIVTGRWDPFNQCTSGYTNNKQYAIHRQQPSYESAVILLDNNWNILLYTMLKHIVDRDKYKKSQLSDCRLFNHLSLVFITCISYKGAGPKPQNLIGPLLWKIDIIDENQEPQIMAYLDSIYIANYTHSTLLKTKQLQHIPKNGNILGKQPKNIIPLSYDNTLYFLWDLTHSYMIKVDLMRNIKNLSNAYDIDVVSGISKFVIFQQRNIKKKYHNSCGFLHLSESNEFLGIGHIHYDIYSKINIPKLVRYGTHYAQFFFTIQDKPPFHIKRISNEFCFISPFNNTGDSCDIIQFVGGMVQNTINGTQYLFISYGINDCISDITVLSKQSVLDTLQNYWDSDFFKKEFGKNV